jgi:zinc D-Ala-D-Ala dipeptidase
MVSKPWVRQRVKLLVLALSTILLLVCCENSLRSATLSPAAQQTQPEFQPNSLLTQRSTYTNNSQLVDIQTINPRIRLDMRYATSNNFLRRKLYPQARCLLRKELAQQLSQVQINLERQGLGLKVYDCYRPLSVQKQMWQVMPDDRFVANPANGSRHNRASAVDVTLVDRKGKELEMPTQFDDFTDKAFSDSENVSRSAKKNRQKLRKAMEAHGFIQLATEWWHFDAKNWQKFPLLDVPLDSIAKE